jgi:NADH-ubiquinone oxidoreductase chain 6
MSTEVTLFSLFSGISLIAGIMVIRAKNPVHSVLFLILVFCSTSGLLLLLGLDFFALVFLVVYVGAIAVLFLFVIMMLNIKLTEITENILRYLPIGGLIGIIFIFEVLLVVDNDLIPLIFSDKLFIKEISFFSYINIFLSYWLIPSFIALFKGKISIASWIEDFSFFHSDLKLIDSISINLDSLKINSYIEWTNQIQNLSNIEMVAQLIYTHYVYYFLMASLVLLVAMIGAITLTMHKSVTVKRQDAFLQNAREFSTAIHKLS